MQLRQGLAWVADHESSALKRLNNGLTLQQALLLDTPGNEVIRSLNNIQNRLESGLI